MNQKRKWGMDGSPLYPWLPSTAPTDIKTFDRRGNREAWLKLRERDKVRKTGMGMKRKEGRQHTTQPARDFEKVGGGRGDEGGKKEGETKEKGEKEKKA